LGKLINSNTIQIKTEHYTLCVLFFCAMLRSFIDRFHVEDTLLIIKPTTCTNFSNLFWNETLHVSDSSSVHHQAFFTVHTAMVYVIQVFWQLASRFRMFHSDPARKLSTKLHDIYHCCVLRHYPTSRKFAGSIPDGAIGILH